MTGYAGHLEKDAVKNKYFRRVLFTGKYNQLVLMCLQPKEEIGNEVHANVKRMMKQLDLPPHRAEKKAPVPPPYRDLHRVPSRRLLDWLVRHVRRSAPLVEWLAAANE